MTRQTLTSGLYTFKEAAERLGIGLAQAYRLDNEGKFPVPTVIVGAVRKVRVAELEHWLQGTAPTPAPGCPTIDDEAADLAAHPTDTAGKLAETMRRHRLTVAS